MFVGELLRSVGKETALGEFWGKYFFQMNVYKYFLIITRKHNFFSKLFLSVVGGAWSLGHE